MLPTRTYQERAARRRRTNPTDQTRSGPQASQSNPPVLPGPSGLEQLTPEMIAAISTAVTQALQAAAGYPISPVCTRLKSTSRMQQCTAQD